MITREPIGKLRECPSRVKIELQDYKGVYEDLDELFSRGISYRNFGHHEFKCRESTSEVITRIRDLLSDTDAGFAVLNLRESLDQGTIQADRARLLVVMIGTAFGQTVTKNHLSDSPFFSVFLRKQGKGGKYIGNALSNNRPGIHTDGSALPDMRVDFMSLLCIRPAFSGGDSIVVNACKVFEALPSEVQSFLLERQFIRQNPYNPNAPDPVRRTIYHPVVIPFYEGLGILYHRTRIEGGHSYMAEPLVRQAINALDTLDKLFYSTNYSYRFLLRSGQILLANNHLICHDRLPFQDTDENPRFLERYWAGTILDK